MPDSVIDMLADLNVASAVFLAVGVCAAFAVPYFLLVNVQQFVPQRLHDAELRERTVLAAQNTVDRSRLALVAALLVVAAYLDPTTASPKKGAHR